MSSLIGRLSLSPSVSDASSSDNESEEGESQLHLERSISITHATAAAAVPARSVSHSARASRLTAADDDGEGGGEVSFSFSSSLHLTHEAYEAQLDALARAHEQEEGEEGASLIDTMEHSPVLSASAMPQPPVEQPPIAAAPAAATIMRRSRPPSPALAPAPAVAVAVATEPAVPAVSSRSNSRRPSLTASAAQPSQAATTAVAAEPTSAAAADATVAPFRTLAFASQSLSNDEALHLLRESLRSEHTPPSLRALPPASVLLSLDLRQNALEDDCEFLAPLRAHRVPLQVLDVSENQLSDLDFLAHFSATLTSLDVRHNALVDADDAVAALAALPQLTTLRVDGNACFEPSSVTGTAARAALIRALPRLQELDDRVVQRSPNDVAAPVQTKPNRSRAPSPASQRARRSPSPAPSLSAKQAPAPQPQRFHSDRRPPSPSPAVAGRTSPRSSQPPSARTSRAGSLVRAEEAAAAQAAHAARAASTPRSASPSPVAAAAPAAINRSRAPSPARTAQPTPAAAQSTPTAPPPLTVQPDASPPPRVSRPSSRPSTPSSSAATLVSPSSVVPPAPLQPDPVTDHLTEQLLTLNAALLATTDQLTRTEEKRLELGRMMNEQQLRHEAVAAAIDAPPAASPAASATPVASVAAASPGGALQAMKSLQAALLERVNRRHTRGASSISSTASLNASTGSESSSLSSTQEQLAPTLATNLTPVASAPLAIVPASDTPVEDQVSKFSSLVDAIDSIVARSASATPNASSVTSTSAVSQAQSRTTSDATAALASARDSPLVQLSESDEFNVRAAPATAPARYAEPAHSSQSSVPSRSHSRIASARLEEAKALSLDAALGTAHPPVNAPASGFAGAQRASRPPSVASSASTPRAMLPSHDSPGAASSSTASPSPHRAHSRGSHSFSPARSQAERAFDELDVDGDDLSFPTALSSARPSAGLRSPLARPSPQAAANEAMLAEMKAENLQLRRKGAALLSRFHAARHELQVHEGMLLSLKRSRDVVRGVALLDSLLARRGSLALARAWAIWVGRVGAARTRGHAVLESVMRRQAHGWDLSARSALARAFGHWNHARLRGKFAELKQRWTAEWEEDVRRASRERACASIALTFRAAWREARRLALVRALARWRSSSLALGIAAQARAHASEAHSERQVLLGLVLQHQAAAEAAEKTQAERSVAHQLALAAAQARVEKAEKELSSQAELVRSMDGQLETLSRSSAAKLAQSRRDAGARSLLHASSRVLHRHARRVLTRWASLGVDESSSGDSLCMLLLRLSSRVCEMELERERVLQAAAAATQPRQEETEAVVTRSRGANNSSQTDEPAVPIPEEQQTSSQSHAAAQEEEEATRAEIAEPAAPATIAPVSARDEGEPRTSRNHPSRAMQLEELSDSPSPARPAPPIPAPAPAHQPSEHHGVPHADSARFEPPLAQHPHLVGPPSQLRSDYELQLQMQQMQAARAQQQHASQRRLAGAPPRVTSPRRGRPEAYSLSSSVRSASPSSPIPPDLSFAPSSLSNSVGSSYSLYPHPAAAPSFPAFGSSPSAAYAAPTASSLAHHASAEDARRANLDEELRRAQEARRVLEAETADIARKIAEARSRTHVGLSSSMHGAQSLGNGVASSPRTHLTPTAAHATSLSATRGLWATDTRAAFPARSPSRTSSHAEMLQIDPSRFLSAQRRQLHAAGARF